MSAPPAPKKHRRSDSRMQDDSVVSEEDEPDSPFTLYFLRLPDADVTDEELRNLNACFKAANDRGICPKWLEVEEIERIQTSDDFFVVPCFRGNWFRELLSKHLKVYGPPIVFECLEEPKALPHWKHAVFSSVLEGAKISFTCIEPERRNELTEKACWMSGVIGGTLYHESTHLVCGRAERTEKYKAAVQNSIQLMKKEWIEDMWDMSQRTMGKFSGVTRDGIAAYKLRVFEGMEMAITSVDGPDRTTIIQLVETHGGKLPGTMSKTRCSHLITDQTNSQKFKKAVDWKIPIVQTRWVRKCIDMDYLIEETKYHPKYLSVEHIRSSTPKRDANVTDNMPDVSSIAGPGGRLSISTLSNSSSLTQNNSILFGQRHRSSVLTSSTSIVASSTIRRKSDQFSTPIARTNTVPLVRHPTTQSTSTTQAASDPIDELRKQAEGLDDLFENCMVFVCGVEESQKEKWWRFLNQTGATRVPKFESATIVIVIAPSQQEKMTIRKYTSHDDIAIVNVSWVNECVKQRRCVSHEGFEWSETQTEDSQSVPSNGSFAHRASSVSCQSALTSYSEPPPIQARGIFATRTYHLHHSIPKDVAAKLAEDLKENGGIIEKNAENAEFVVCAHSFPLHELIEYSTVITDLYVEACINNKQCLRLSDHPLFVPLPRPPLSVFNQTLFYLHSTAPILRNYVKAIIESCGGCVTENINSKTLVVMMERAKMPTQYRSCTVVDLSWVVASMSECKAQAIGDHLYKDDTAPLQDYQREDDLWTKSTREKDTTQEIEEFEEEEERNRVDAPMEIEQERENRGLTPLENPYFPDLRKPYKMNLHLDGVSEIINNMPSPTPETQDSLTTSRVGSILRTAAYNTGRQRERPEEIVRPPSAVIAENRRTVSSTPVLQRVADQQRLVDLDETLMEQNQEHVEELNRRYAMHPHFVLSTSDQDQSVTDRIKDGIKTLGGIIENQFDKDVSILIVARLNRTPKTLCAIAAGKWCLTPEYVFESVSAGHWLEEEPFEWNPSKVVSCNQKSERLEKNLARVCSEWRTRVARMPITCSVSMDSRKNGAFTGWRCIVHEHDKTTSSVVPILEAGGAFVRVVSEYVEVADHKPTIAVASRTFDWNIQSAVYLKRNRIPLYLFEYIYHFLIKKDGDDLSYLLHPNYQKA